MVWETRSPSRCAAATDGGEGRHATGNGVKQTRVTGRKLGVW